MGLEVVVLGEEFAANRTLDRGLLAIAGLPRRRPKVGGRPVDRRSAVVSGHVVDRRPEPVENPLVGGGDVKWPLPLGRRAGLAGKQFSHRSFFLVGVKLDEPLDPSAGEEPGVDRRRPALDDPLQRLVEPLANPRGPPGEVGIVGTSQPTIVATVATSRGTALSAATHLPS